MTNSSGPVKERNVILNSLLQLLRLVCLFPLISLSVYFFFFFSSFLFSFTLLFFIYLFFFLPPPSFLSRLPPSRVILSFIPLLLFFIFSSSYICLLRVERHRFFQIMPADYGAASHQYRKVQTEPVVSESTAKGDTRSSMNEPEYNETLVIQNI